MLDVVLLLVVVVVVVVVLAVVDVVVALLDSPPLPPDPEVLVLVSWFSRSLPQPGANQNAAETRPICSAITKVLASTVSLVARVKGGNGQAMIPIFVPPGAECPHRGPGPR